MTFTEIKATIWNLIGAGDSNLCEEALADLR